MVCNFLPVSHLVCGQSAEWAYISTINKQTLATNSCQMKIMTLYITVFAQAAQWIQPTYFQHNSTREPEHYRLFMHLPQKWPLALRFSGQYFIYIFEFPPCATCLLYPDLLNMCINFLTILEGAYNLGSFSLYSLLLKNRGFFIVCLGYMRVLQKTHLICDYQSNKHWSNNRHDVCHTIGNPHHYASIIWGQINVIHLETHINSTVQSDGNCKQCHCCCGIFGADEVQSKQSQTRAPVSCDQRVNMGYMFLKYAECLN